MSQDPGRDPAFMDVIHKHMHVPEHLSVGPRQQRHVEEGDEAMKWPEDPPPAYSMQVPERLTYTGRLSNALVNVVVESFNVQFCLFLLHKSS